MKRFEACILGDTAPRHWKARQAQNDLAGRDKSKATLHNTGALDSTTRVINPLNDITKMPLPRPLAIGRRGGRLA